MEKYGVFLGEVALDEYYDIGRWPGAGEKVYINPIESIPGGMVANAACVSSSLGFKTYFSYVLNRGDVSKLLIGDLNKYGVDTSFVAYDDNLPDSKVMLFMSGSDHTILIPFYEISQIDIGEKGLELLKSAEFVYTTPSAIKLLRCGNTDSDEIIDAFRSSGTKLVFDFDVDYLQDKNEDIYKNLDIGFFNEAGFRSVMGGREADETAGHLINLGMELVVVTYGSRGCIVYGKDKKESVNAKKVDVVDVTGAGDTFCASFMVELTSGKSPREAALFATSAAAVCISGFGARSGAVGRKTVLEMLGK
ncbi:MAG: carbohydrate kinase family protein [Ruminococcaceae bacterium]|nr:carbohydrate kinase family protein [Oscillospiraceae bacterium]